MFLCDYGAWNQRLSLRVIAEIFTLVGKLLQHMDVFFEFKDIIRIKIHHNRQKLGAIRKTLRITFSLHQLSYFFKFRILAHKFCELVRLVELYRLNQENFYVY